MTNTSELSRRAAPTAPSVEPTSAERLEVEDSELDYSDIPATAEADWKDAGQGKFYRPKQQPQQ